MLPPRAYIFIGLNAVRALSVIAMLLVLGSSIFNIVQDVESFNDFQSTTNSTTSSNYQYVPNSDVPNQTAGIFWAVINHILIFLEVIALILSEIGWPLSFFDHYFPVLGSNFGVGALGIFQCLIGATILSHYVDDFTLVSGFFLFSLGCVNMFIGLVFRERVKGRRSIFAWRERAKDVLPTSVTNVAEKVPPLNFLNKNQGQPVSEFGQKAGYGFGRQGEKAAGLKGFLISKPLETLPRYAPAVRPDHSADSRSSTPEPRFKSSSTAI